MHRLAVFQHNIVCDVNDVVYRANAARSESFSHPTGRGAYLYVGYRAGDIAAAKLVILHLNLEHIVDIALSGGNDRLLDLQLLVKGDSRFTRETDNAETIGAVGGYLKFNHHIVKTDGFLYIFSEGEIFFLENKDAVFNRIGEIMNGKTQLAERTEHTFAQLTAQLGGLDGVSAGQLCAVNRCGNYIPDLEVVGTGDYLKRFFPADINLAYHHVVGIGVVCDGEYLAYNDILYLRSLKSVALYLGAGHCHSLAEGSGGHFIKADIIAEPSHRKIHNSLPSLIKTDRGTADRSQREGAGRRYCIFSW